MCIGLGGMKLLFWLTWASLHCEQHFNLCSSSIWLGMHDSCSLQLSQSFKRGDGLVYCMQVLQHYKEKVACIVADKSADDVAKQIREAVQQ